MVMNLGFGPIESNGPAARGKGMPNSPLIKSGTGKNRASRVGVVGPKPKSAAPKNKRKTSVTRRGGEMGTFPRSVLPAAAALN